MNWPLPGLLSVSEGLKTLLSYLPVPTTGLSLARHTPSIWLWGVARETTTGLTRSHSLGFLLFSYYPVHFVSHFFTVMSHAHIHAHAQQLTCIAGVALASSPGPSSESAELERAGYVLYELYEL